MRDLSSNIDCLVAFAPKAAVQGAPQTSQTVDRQGYNSLVLALLTGVLTDTNAVWSVKIQDSPDKSTWTDVVDGELIGTEALAGFKFSDDTRARKIGYIGLMRYVRATIDDTTTNTGNLFLAGVWILGNPEVSPTNNPPTIAAG